MCSLLLRLPVDILLNIFKRLDTQDIINVILTCKNLREIICNDNLLWKYISQNKFILKNSIDNGNIHVNLSWYNRCRISYNWINGFYKDKVIVRHSENYMPWLKYHNSDALIVSIGSEFYCYSADKKGFLNCRQPLWRLYVPTIKRFDVRTNDISRFILKDELLVCGNRDGCASIFRYNGTSAEPSLINHIKDCHNYGLAEVSAVELISGHDTHYVVTASNNDPHILLWQQNDLELKENTSEHNDESCNEFANMLDILLDEYRGVKCLAVNHGNNRLAIGPNGNSKPLLVDVNVGVFLMMSYATKVASKAVRDIQWHDDNTLVYVTHSGILQLIDVRSQMVTYDAKDPFGSSSYCVKTDGDRAIIVGSAEYSRCSLFDYRMPQCKQIFFTQKKRSPVYSLDFDSTTLIAAVDRGIAALNFDVIAATTEQHDYSSFM